MHCFSAIYQTESKYLRTRRGPGFIFESNHQICVRIPEKIIGNILMRREDL